MNNNNYNDMVFASSPSAAWERRRALGDEVFAALDGLPLATIELLSRALVLSGGLLKGMGEVFRLYSAFPQPSPLARIRCGIELGRLAHADGCDEFLERIADASDQPWPALRAAVLEIQEFEA